VAHDGDLFDRLIAGLGQLARLLAGGLLDPDRLVTDMFGGEVQVFRVGAQCLVEIADLGEAVFSGLGKVLDLAAHDRRQFLDLVGTALHHARQLLRPLRQYPVQPARDFACPLVERIAHRRHTHCRRPQERLQGLLLAL
jgi:hypothetical protein